MPSYATVRPCILVIGGYGVFGGRLSRRLAAHDDVKVIVAGRNLDAAQAHCTAHGGAPERIDANGDLEEIFHRLKPTVVIDAAGPFQFYKGDPYRIARAALNCGAHYLDLADDADFVSGIGVIDDAAKQNNLTALSGCSSVPAISAAAVAALSQDITAIDSIESIIMPGNGAPRGLSVVKAILAQAGKPIRVLRGGEWSTIHGWCAVATCTPDIAGHEGLGRRYISRIGAPDLQLFPKHFAARTIRFRAGLELSVMHLGLVVIAWLVRLGLLQSAVPLSGSLLWIANHLKPFGTDRGAMTVDVIGRTLAGHGQHRRWTLLAEAGDGPEIPPTPAYLLALRLCRNRDQVAPGARPCLDALTLDDIEAGLAPFAIMTEVMSLPIPTVFGAALQNDFAQLPAPIRELHDVLDIMRFNGRARIDRGESLMSRLIGWCMGFPLASPDIDVAVEMQRTRSSEIWTRAFGRHTFRSHLFRFAGAQPGQIWERFGPLSFRINLKITNAGLEYPIDAARFLGIIPLPRFLLPASETREYVDSESRACFDVKISHPLAGFLVRYRGWLQSVASGTNQSGVTAKYNPVQNGPM